ncbi:MAG: ribosome maturation factor RimM [Thermoanaerobaculia bacterium]
MSSRSPNEGPPPLPDRVLIGRVRRPHGVRGELLVDVVSDVPGRLAPGRELWLETPAGAGRTVTVAANRPHPRGALVLFEGYDDRDAAEPLRGAALETERSTVTPAPAGSYYYFELAGCLCRDTHHGELGQVSEVIEDGGGLLLEVRAGERLLLVPFVQEYIAAVDVPGRRIELQLPDGLVETCTSAS